MKLKNVSSLFNAFQKRCINTQPQKKRDINWIKPIGFETGIRVYNPITKCKTPLILQNENFATWYMCGPTLYDSAHIGHACTYVRFDIIRRILNEFFNINVVQVMSLTDIDDKIINKSLQTGQDFLQITKFYEKEFFEDLNELNVVKPYLSCRVTDYVPQIIEFVSRLINNGHAYVTESGTVYFNTSKYENYGKLSEPIIDEMEAGLEKKFSSDFALWKSAKKDEPFWESPWGNGRPGWHIECSAIASTVLGNRIDIHSGGIDLAFPHHENEEAQSCCYFEEYQWINYWLHTGHLFLRNEKMSKSLKNTISIQDLLKKYSANEFRLFCLMTTYRHGIEFTDTKLMNAAVLMQKITHFLQSCEDYISGKLRNGNVIESELLKALNETKKKVSASLQNDFNTGAVMSEISHLIGVANKMLSEKETNVSARSVVTLAMVSRYVASLLEKFGIQNVTRRSTNDQSITGILDSYVKFREIVRNDVLKEKTKNLPVLKACDDARNELLAFGVHVKDQKPKSTWTFCDTVKRS